MIERKDIASISENYEKNLAKISCYSMVIEQNKSDQFVRLSEECGEQHVTKQYSLLNLVLKDKAVKVDIAKYMFRNSKGMMYTCIGETYYDEIQCSKLV